MMPTIRSILLRRMSLVCLSLMTVVGTVSGISRRTYHNPRYTELNYGLVLTLNSGLSALQTPSTDIKQKTGLTFGATIEGTYFHSKYFGVTGGIGFMRWSDNLQLENKTFTWQDVPDIEGETYDHSVNLHSLKERVQIYYFDLPIKVNVMLPIRFFGMMISVGVMPSFPISNRSHTEASLQHSGFYPQWNLNFDVRKYGFYESDDFTTSYTFKPNPQIFAIGAFDLIFSITQNVELFVGIEAQYGFINLVKKTRKNAIGFINDSPQGIIYHPFMEKYRTLLETTEFTGTIHPYAFNLRFGLRLLKFSLRRNGYSNYGKD